MKKIFSTLFVLALALASFTAVADQYELYPRGDVSEDGRVGVYILESAAYKWKTVEILYDNGESYIVRLDKSSTQNLWPGDDIIVDDKDAYDGKVVV